MLKKLPVPTIQKFALFSCQDAKRSRPQNLACPWTWTFHKSKSERCEIHYLSAGRFYSKYRWRRNPCSDMVISRNPSIRWCPFWFSNFNPQVVKQKSATSAQKEICPSLIWLQAKNDLTCFSLLSSTGRVESLKSSTTFWSLPQTRTSPRSISDSLAQVAKKGLSRKTSM